MRELIAGRVYEIAPGEYAVYGMVMLKLPDSREEIPVQDIENPLCVVKVGVRVADLQAIVDDMGKKATETD